MSLGRSLRLVLSPPHPAGRPFIIGGVAVALVGGGFLGGLALLARHDLHPVLPLLLPRPEAGPAGPGAARAGAGGWACRQRHAGGASGGARPRPGAALAGGDLPSVLDVHVNRVPADGTVTRIAYRHGKLPQRRARQGERGQRAQRDRAEAAGWPRHGGGADRRADRPAHPVRHPRRRRGQRR